MNYITTLQFKIDFFKGRGIPYGIIGLSTVINNANPRNSYFMWDNCTQYEANELEKIQHEAARIVSGATKLVSIEKIIKELDGILSLAEEKT